MGIINFNKVISYSLTMCKTKSMGRCAEYVKKAFQAGGAKYVAGNGWTNQKWCQTNDFQLIGDFIPENGNPRKFISTETSTICNVNGMQFPKMADGSNYKQQMGDVCLIKHGQYGHICYAMSDDIDSWVSDYFQKYPGQKNGTGPYCYTGGIERVQFWRHKSLLNGAPVIELKNIEEYKYTQNTSSSSSSTNKATVTPNTISGMNVGSKKTSLGIVLGYHMKQK